MHRFPMTYAINPHRHDGVLNTNVTGDAGLSLEMRTYYDKVLLKNAFPNLVHNQFGQKRPIPKGNSKTINFRKMTPLAKTPTPLTESVTPDGQKLSMTEITALVQQYGGYFTYSDILETTTIDPVIQEGTEMLGHAAGETLDTLTREVLNAGTVVQYGDGTVASRNALVAFDGTWANNDYFSTEVIRRALLTLRNNKARPVKDGSFVCIIHPESEYALKKDADWKEAQEYAGAERIFNGEIGKFDNCRFVVSTEAKIWSPAALAAAGQNLTVASLDTKTFTVAEALTAGDKAAMEGRYIWVKGVNYSVKTVTAGAAGAATIEVNETVTGTPGAGEIVYPGDLGKTLARMPDKGASVGACLFIGADAYGITELEGMGMQTIIKPKGSAGSADPLNQRGTVGWKATHVAKILSELWMVRAEVALPHKLAAN